MCQDPDVHRLLLAEVMHRPPVSLCLFLDEDALMRGTPPTPPTDPAPQGGALALFKGKPGEPRPCLASVLHPSNMIFHSSRPLVTALGRRRLTEWLLSASFPFALVPTCARRPLSLLSTQKFISQQTASEAVALVELRRRRVASLQLSGRQELGEAFKKRKSGRKSRSDCIDGRLQPHGAAAALAGMCSVH